MSVANSWLLGKELFCFGVLEGCLWHCHDTPCEAWITAFEAQTRIHVYHDLWLSTGYVLQTSTVSRWYLAQTLYNRIRTHEASMAGK
jgi:hypothetical protein